MELARKSLALELLCLDDARKRVTADPLGEIDRDRRPVGQALRQAQVVVREARARPCLVVRDDDADRAPTSDQRDVERRADAELPRRLLIDLRVLEHGVDPFAAAPLEHATCLRPSELETGSDDAVRALALGCSDRHGVALRERDQDESRVDELPQPPSDEAEQRLELDLGGERGADLVQRLELAQPPGGGLVEARVLDRDGSLGGEELRQLLVLLGEVVAALLLREVEVAVGHTSQEDRHAEERLSSADGGAGSRPSASRLRCRAAAASGVSRIRTPSSPRPRGRSPIAACVSSSIPVVRNRSSPCPALSMTPRAAYRAPVELGGRLDESLEQRVERELGAECDPRVDEHAKAIGLRRRPVHAAILPLRGLVGGASAPRTSVALVSRK